MRWAFALVGAICVSLLSLSVAQELPGPVESPVWETQPPFAVLPPEGGPVVGGVALTCRVAAGALTGCTSSDAVPASYVEAGLISARAARLAPQDADGQPTEGREIVVRIPFPIPVMTRAAPASGSLTGLIWLQAPTGNDYARLYPEAAARQGTDGTVVLDCLVGDDGRLSCTIVSEEPAGWGFGEATLALSRLFHLAPRTSNGTPTAGERIRRTIRWRIS